MPYDLVVIGASWGGLEALSRLLSELPRDFGPAVVIAQHRSPQSEGTGLGDFLERHARRPVKEPSDKDPIVAGEVYLAPADYHLLVDRNAFALSTDAAVQHSRPSIDVLFESAADAFAERLIAVVLTGANDDGARGVVRVKQCRGYTLAQDPASAEKPAMPEAAIATGAVDAVVGLDELAPLLDRLARGEEPGINVSAAMQRPLA